jgi:hypothetical protein
MVERGKERKEKKGNLKVEERRKARNLMDVSSARNHIEHQ